MRAQLVVLLTITLFLAGPLMAAAPADRQVDGSALSAYHPPARLYLKAGTFDPVTDPAPGPSWLHERSTAPYYVVQFDGPIQKAWRDAASAAGATLIAYLPDFGYFARIPGASLTRFEALDHLRYLGPAHLAYRIDPSLWYDTTVRDLELVTFDREGAPLLADAVAYEGGGVLAFDTDHVTATMAPSMAMALATDASLGIEWVEPNFVPVPTLDNDARSSKARQMIDGAYSADGQSLWSYDPATGTFEGYPGRNVTVAVDDSGLDSTHPAFSGRIAHYYDYGGDGQGDSNGHGTHVAGIVLGDGSWRTGDTGAQGKYAGIAPQAKLVVQEIFNNVYGPTVYNRDATRAGASIESNSWGYGQWGAYYSTCQEYDDATRDSDSLRPGDQPLLITFSAGNDGDWGAGTVSPPGTAKNVITVGASGNDREYWATSNDVVSFSSKGPTLDGRLKPDVVMPGQDVESTRSIDSGAVSGWYVPPDGQSSYVWASGTSMASPGVSGSAAVVTQYLKEVDGLASPSPALLKASLINGARPLAGYEYPGNIQGWGAVDLVHTLIQTDSYKISRDDQSVALDTATGASSQSYWFMVYNDAPLKVTLVWTDPGGVGSSSKALVNDLDLELRAPDGTIYLGNAFSDGESQPDTAIGTPDRVNNVEGFLLRTPMQGIWTIKVKAYNVPQGPQDFALVVSGHATKGHIDLAVDSLTADPAAAEEYHPVTVTARLGNLGNRASGVFWYRLERTAPDGTTETLANANLTDLAAGGHTDISWTFTGARGVNALTLTLDPGDLIPESNETNNVFTLDYFFRGYDATLSVERPELHPDPGRIADFDVVVGNGGNVPDEFSVSITAAPPGWHASLIADTFNLTNGDTAHVAVSLMAPSNATAGERAVLLFTAAPLGNTSRSQTTTLVAIVNQVFEMDMSAPTDHLQLLPGANGTFDVVISNPGNGLDTYELQMPANLAAGWWIVLPQSRVTVGPRSQSTVPVVLNAPDPAPAGTTVDFYIGGKSTMSGMERSVRLFAVVLQFYDSRLEATHREWDADVGTTITVPLLLRNLGNGQVEYVFDVATPSSEWEASCAPGSIMVTGYGSGSANLIFTVPARAINQTYDISLAAIPSGGPVIHHNFTFAARQFHSMGLAPVSQAPPVVTQGKPATVFMRLSNLGNGVEQAKLLAPDLPDLWAYSVGQSVYEVGPFAYLDVPVTLETSKESPGGTYRVGLEARYAYDMSTNATAEVKLLTRPDLAFLPGAPNVSEAAPVVGSLVQVSLSVENTGGTVAKDVYLQIYVDGVPLGQAQYVSSIGPGETENFTVPWLTNTSGAHVVSAVVDITHDIDETREDNNAASTTVTVQAIHYKTTPALPWPLVAVILVAAAMIAVGARMARARRHRGSR